MPEWKKKIPKIDYVSAFASTIEQIGFINGFKNVDKLLNPTEFDLHDPYLLTNIEDAANTILSHTNKANTEGKKVGISFDVDSDGITSGSEMYIYLSQIVHPDLLYPIYVERTEGHGIENQLHMVQDDTTLVVICDSSSGASSVDACKSLKDKGIEIVILDHHPVALNINRDVVNTHAIIVNPQLPGDKYPNKSLSGAGVVYKTIQVMNDSVGLPEDILNQILLPLVAVGLSSDMMDVSEMENRHLIREGLKKMVEFKESNPGLISILKVNKVDPKFINSQVIGFTIGPMLNGAARMGNIKLAIDLILNRDAFECGMLAKEIKGLNDERKVIEKKIFNDMLHMVDVNDKVVVAWDEEIGKSFSGLVATKFANEFKRPAIVLRRQGKFLSGSYRGISDINMREVLKGFIERMREDYSNPEYGFVEGHEQAGGIGLDMSDLNLLRKYLNEYFAGTTFETALEYDLDVDADDITTEMMKEVERYDYITGQGWPQSKFVVRGLNIIKREIIGKNLDTVKFTCDNDMILIKFRSDPTFGEEFSPKDEPTQVDVLGSLNINTWYHGGLKRYVSFNQVFIDDIKLSIQ